MTTLVDHTLKALGRAGAPGVHRLVNWLRPADRITAGEAGFHCRFAGLEYEGLLTEHIDREIFYFGAYAPGELAFLDYAARVLAPPGGLNFFDIGANVGQHSLWMSQRAAKVFAFEPSVTAVQQLQGNLERNAITNVTVFPFALGDEAMTANLGSGFPHNAGSRSLTWTLDETRSEAIAVHRGEDVFREHDLPPLHLMKMDVEGFEHKVLKGLAQRLAQDRPVVLMELIGSAAGRSGFADEAQLRAALYPDHQLYSIGGGKARRLMAFDWNVEEMVCVPREVADRFAALVLA